MESAIRKPIIRHLNTSSELSFRISDKKLIIKEKSGTRYLNKDKIVYCKSDSNYTMIYLDDQSTILCSKCLKLINSQLSENNFFRIHASYLINLNYLDQINITQKQVTIQSKIVLPIAKSRFQNLLSYLK